MKRMPVIFIGHGSPMNTPETNRYTQTWRGIGANLPRPRAVLAISARAGISGRRGSPMAAPRTIHDFYGFPSDVFAFEYPMGPRSRARGVLAHMYPAADWRSSWKGEPI